MRITTEEMKTVLAKHNVPVSTFVETGTMKATLTLRMKSVFDSVFSIELSYGLYSRAIQLYGNEDGIKFLYGDSGEVIKWVSDFLPYPTCFLLDAHHIKGGTIIDKTRNKKYVSAEGSFPLWKELDIIASRPYDDIILIDDVKLFGYDREDWSAVTKQSILDRVKQYKTVNQDYVISDDYCLHMGGLNEDT